MIEIEYLDDTEDVFDITVEGNHNFFANNILVHNCQEIALVSKPFVSVEQLYKPVPEELITFENENGEEISIKFDTEVLTQRGKVFAISLQEGDEILKIIQAEK